MFSYLFIVVVLSPVIVISGDPIQEAKEEFEKLTVGSPHLKATDILKGL